MMTRKSPGRFACVAIAALLVISCTTLDPYTREEKTSNATKGAAIGAATGVVVGLLSGDDASERKRNALIMGGVGALAGGAVGYYTDQQELELRKRLEGTGVSVTRIGDNITLNMPGNVTFAVDSADISANFYPVLDSVAQVLKKYNKSFVEVAGHTDSTGSKAYNQLLSEKRAQSVVSYFVSRGIRGDRFIVVGGGEDHPIASNSTPEGRQMNRRVEITIVPLTRN